MDIAGISAVVTGGASGLGEATARLLAAAGAKVAIFDLDKARGEALADSIGGVFCNVNVTSQPSTTVVVLIVGDNELRRRRAGVGDARGTIGGWPGDVVAAGRAALRGVS